MASLMAIIAGMLGLAVLLTLMRLHRQGSWNRLGGFLGLLLGCCLSFAAAGFIMWLTLRGQHGGFAAQDSVQLAGLAAGLLVFFTAPLAGLWRGGQMPPLSILLGGD